jgi:hypothetical protein
MRTSPIGGIQYPQIVFAFFHVSTCGKLRKV